MCQKRIVWAMLKKGKRKISMPKRHERKMHAKEYEEKKRKKKERNKDSLYFQIMALIQIERDS
jgi:hypothetical protein